MEPKYSVDITLEQDDIKRFAKMLQGDHKKGYLLTAVAIIWILYAAISNIRGGKTVMGGFMLAVVILAPLSFLYATRRQVRKSYQIIKESGGDRYTVLFYDDHFETKGEKSHGSYEYANLNDVIETDTDFYLEVAKGQSVILQKQKCNSEVSAFIRDIRKKIN